MVTVTKREAVQTLIEGAMHAYSRNDLICTLTLAGAAEGAMPPSPDKTLFNALVSTRMELFSEGFKKAVREVNDVRDWLKHYGPDQPLTMDIDGALNMITRALMRFDGVYGRDQWTQAMTDFVKCPPRSSSGSRGFPT